jgi:HMG (high mobility group) box
MIKNNCREIVHKGTPRMISTEKNLYEAKDFLSSDTSIELPLKRVVANPNSCFLPYFTSLSLEKPEKKRSWRKPKDKPKRPLSAYNLFFQSERQKLIAILPDIADLGEYSLTDRERKVRHRKMHGKIGFAELARNIANKWHNLDETEKATFEACARTEKEKYQEEIDKWKATDSYSQTQRKEKNRNAKTKVRLQDFLPEFSPSDAAHSGIPCALSSLYFSNLIAFQSLTHDCNQSESKIDNMASYIPRPTQDFTSRDKNFCVKSFVFEYDQECRSHLHSFQMKGNVSDSFEKCSDECSTFDGKALDDFLDNSCYNSDYEDDFSI